MACENVGRRTSLVCLTEKEFDTVKYSCFLSIVFLPACLWWPLSGSSSFLVVGKSRLWSHSIQVCVCVVCSSWLCQSWSFQPSPVTVTWPVNDYLVPQYFCTAVCLSFLGCFDHPILVSLRVPLVRLSPAALMTAGTVVPRMPQIVHTWLIKAAANKVGRECSRDKSDRERSRQVQKLAKMSGSVISPPTSQWWADLREAPQPTSGLLTSQLTCQPLVYWTAVVLLCHLPPV